MKRNLLSLAIAIPLLASCAAAGDLAKSVGSGLQGYSGPGSSITGLAGRVTHGFGAKFSPEPAASAPAGAAADPKPEDKKS